MKKFLSTIHNDGNSVASDIFLAAIISVVLFVIWKELR